MVRHKPIRSLFAEQRTAGQVSWHISVRVAVSIPSSPSPQQWSQRRHSNLKRGPPEAALLDPLMLFRFREFHFSKCRWNETPFPLNHLRRALEIRERARFLGSDMFRR